MKRASYRTDGAETDKKIFHSGEPGLNLCFEPVDLKYLSCSKGELEKCSMQFADRVVHVYLIAVTFKCPIL